VAVVELIPIRAVPGPDVAIAWSNALFVFELLSWCGVADRFVHAESLPGVFIEVVGKILRNSSRVFPL
jgi:hypothetical protein